MKARWSTLGFAWKNDKDREDRSMFGYIDLGIFGEIRVMFFVDGEGDFTIPKGFKLKISSLAHRLPLNQLDMLGKDVENEFFGHESSSSTKPFPEYGEKEEEEEE